MKGLFENFEKAPYALNEERVRSLALKHGTPFYAYDGALIKKQYERLQNSFKAQNIKLNVHYSVKANSNLAILCFLKSLGSQFDVVSGGEISRCLKSNATGKDIVFAGVGKNSAEIDLALETGILQFNVESEDELRLISMRAKALGKVAQVALRINPDVDAKTHAYITTGTYTSKFGISVPEALRIYKEWNKEASISWVGLDMHIGSQMTEEAPILEALKCFASFVKELAAHNIQLKNLDFGGGLGVAYKDEKVISPERFAALVAEGLQGIELSKYKLIMEPGRYLVAESGVLVTKVQYIKDLEKKCFVITDAGMTELMRPTLYGAYHEANLVTQNGVSAADRNQRLLDIVGPICESSDYFAKDRMGPLPTIGDLMVIRNCGAYASSMSHTYNTRGRVPEVLLEADGQEKLIRRRETLEDLLRLEIEV